MPRLLLTVLIVASCVPMAAAEDAAAPFGIESRVAWTTSRLVGSPEPPLPYTVEKTFTAIEWKSPVFVADEPGTDRLLIILQGGGKDQPSRIVRVADDPAAMAVEPFLEIPDRLVYAVCFHPDYAKNGYLYAFSNGPTSAADRADRITRYAVDRNAPHAVDPKSEHTIIEWRSAGHDGGDLAFGLDGMLYITTGDGTGDSDTWNSGQTLDDLLGSVLRIDVDHATPEQAYSVPPDNPFVKTPAARGEIWAYGLRNPWRMTVDPKTGHVWVGNNGQDQWETAHLVHAGDNYGWSVYEGSHPFYLERQRGPTPLVPPTIEHSHAEFRSLTGGVVYYGSVLPDLDGAYIYGDYSTGRIWGMKHDGQRVVWHRELADTSLQIAAFRVDHRGELLVIDHGSGIYRLIPSPKNESSAPFPTRLSETGLFTSTADHHVAPGLIPYSVNASAWADGAEAERFIALPGDAKIGYVASGSWTFPDGTALVQTLSLPRAADNPATGIRIETRVFLRQQGEWAGYSYRWNDDQTDAVLVPKEGADVTLADGRAWRIASRTECLTCHSRAATFVLGLTEAQLNRDHNYGTVTDNQLRTLGHLDIFTSPPTKPPQELARLVDPRDASADLEARARAYLHVNCSVCHVAAGGGNAQMELGSATALQDMKLIGARPQHDTFGIPNAMLAAPAEPDRSILVHRLDRRGPGQMPPLVTKAIDQQAVQLMRDWIASLKPAREFVRQWQMEDVLPQLEQIASGRSLASGEAAFRDTGCIQCHRFGSEGGTVGPNLTDVAKRAKPREVLESILLPSKVIADEYAAYAFETAEGKVVSGRIEREDDRVLLVRPPATTDPPVEIAKSDVVERHRLDRSNMPAGTVDVLKKEELLDLVAYLLSKPAQKAANSP